MLILKKILISRRRVASTRPPNLPGNEGVPPAYCPYRRFRPARASEPDCFCFGKHATLARLPAAGPGGDHTARKTSVPIRKIILANPRGFCAGVVRAIEVVEQALDLLPPPIYVFHEIVHNSHVVGRLSGRGVVFVNCLEEVPDGSICIFSAHGVSPAVRRLAERKQLQVVDATCPLVTKVHLEAIRFTREGYSLVLIGHPGHDEVDGTMGEAPMHLVSSVQDVETLQVSNPDKVVFLTQTTLSLDDTAQIVEALRARYPRLTSPPKDDICYATQNRQNAVKEVARHVDLMLVVGSSNSSNSQRLTEAAQAAGVPAYLVNDETGIRSEWLEQAEVVGVTAGASAPEEIVLQVVDRLKSSRAVEVEGLELEDERVQFAIPQELVQIAAH
ncbi:MAG: 4-hydroxy-3-methylbut-2-enyl diphosphate reductase [Acidobacteria bacterium]|nr:4-hydroxy-3-methylbut-2-enyl diphosphate reductase [Acidobacteriota bacterium]